MRAFTHISALAAPDYALRVPLAVRALVTAGLAAGLAGLGLLVAKPILPAFYAALLLGLGLISGGFAVAISVITSPRRRERARREMMDAIAWRGDERVLDVGCGNGFLLIEAAKHLTSGFATGIDVWKTEAGQQTAEVARRNAHLEGVADRVEIKNADARRMPFDDNSFDVIVSSLMLHHAGGSADRQQVLQEMTRVLKLEGTLLLYDAAPLISGAAGTLRASGLTAVERSGQLMALLRARRSLAHAAAGAM